MKPVLITDTPRKIIGIEVRTSNADEADSQTARIPALWQKYFQIAASIPHKKNEREILGVYTDYESNHTGKYTLMVSSEVEIAESVPGDLIAREIPSAKYLVFIAEGEMPGALIKTWMQIWQYFSDTDEFRRAYTADFEVHNLDESSKVEIYIAIE